jgi:hypothetical protein
MESAFGSDNQRPHALVCSVRYLTSLGSIWAHTGGALIVRCRFVLFSVRQRLRKLERIMRGRAGRLRNALAIVASPYAAGKSVLRQAELA